MCHCVRQVAVLSINARKDFYYAQVIIIGFLRELRYFKGKVKASNILNGMKHILVTGFSLSLVCVVEEYSLLKKCILIIFLPV